MRTLVPLLLAVVFAFGQAPAEYKLLKQFHDKKDINTALFILNNYPNAVFIDELRLELADLLLQKGNTDRARFVLIGLNLNNVRDEYGEVAHKLWKALSLEPKELVLRFPEVAPELILSFELSEEERRSVVERLLRKKKYEEVLKLSTNCGDRGVALFKLKRYEEAVSQLKGCEDERAQLYLLWSYIRLQDYEKAERFLRYADREELYFKYAWHLLYKGENKKARKYFILAGFSFRPLFYVGIIDYISGKYLRAYEYFAEAERFAKGNIDKARALFWRYKTLKQMGVEDLADYHLKQASEKAGFYAVRAKKILGLPVYEEVKFKSVGKPSPLSYRLSEIYRLGFIYYMRKEAFLRENEFTLADIFELLRIDPYTAIKLSVRIYGANSSVYRAVAFPTPFRVYVKRASKKFRVEPALIYAVMRQESLFDVLALSRSDAKGLMQLLDKTAQWKAQRIGLKYKDVFDIETNITLGTAYLRFLLDFWKGDVARAIASYNAGQGAVKKWRQYEDELLFMENIPYDETRKYVRRVLWFYYVYKDKLSDETF